MWTPCDVQCQRSSNPFNSTSCSLSSCRSINILDQTCKARCINARNRRLNPSKSKVSTLQVSSRQFCKSCRRSANDNRFLQLPSSPAFLQKTTAWPFSSECKPRKQFMLEMGSLINPSDLASATFPSPRSQVWPAYPHSASARGMRKVSS